jgi:hypothetical protein
VHVHRDNLECKWEMYFFELLELKKEWVGLMLCIYYYSLVLYLSLSLLLLIAVAGGKIKTVFHQLM